MFLAKNIYILTNQKVHLYKKGTFFVVVLK